MFFCLSRCFDIKIAYFTLLSYRVHGLYAIIITDRDGIPVVKGTVTILAHICMCIFRKCYWKCFMLVCHYSVILC